MSTLDPDEKHNITSERFYALEKEISELTDQIQNLEYEKRQVEERKDFYNKIADFSNDWELWFSTNGSLMYCSPSSMDITGYSPKQVMTESSLMGLLVYEEDREPFSRYLKDVLSLTIIRQPYEFRLVTRSRQIRWCEISCRAVHDKFGKYLGIRASVRDITKLKEALGHIKHLSEEKRLSREMQNKLTGEIEAKEREISSYLLILSQKNELIRYLEKNISKLDSLNTQYRQKKIAEMMQKIEQNNTSEMDWELFKVQFDNLYPGFFQDIEAKHPNLTQNDLRLCAFLKLNLSSKEIAGLVKISPKSVEVARVRLRKKLNLLRTQTLKKYFSDF